MHGWKSRPPTTAHFTCAKLGWSARQKALREIGEIQRIAAKKEAHIVHTFRHLGAHMCTAFVALAEACIINSVGWTNRANAIEHTYYTYIITPGGIIETFRGNSLDIARFGDMCKGVICRKLPAENARSLYTNRRTCVYVMMYCSYFGTRGCRPRNFDLHGCVIS